ncbi:UvrD-helicase domain-containing protein [Muricauda sp. HICW]|uniref:DNA 3'-5' helicase II n=1 Tax=Flagellimonas chongwuensis TaxID=2697365 RepID=A0A850NI88_9FLAO|nr:UvrD-helicase domain-containing protein [Allomuricauda chongwuensis]NVN18242.1 UvrD-helicase domain-containing protein [Allomuricauda chongwuensis]
MELESNVNIDDVVEQEIQKNLDFNNPKSFFLFAGAGSGKTRTLINVLKFIKKEHDENLKLNNQKIAIITYTNAACDEIKSRIDYDPLFSVSTIHSFTWNLIKHFTTDIKDWLKNKLKDEIADLEDKQSRARGMNKSFIDRAKKIESKSKRLSILKNINAFVYNPNGDNVSKDSLNHSEVIELGAYFLNTKELMQNILVRKYPILLIDESQDTNKHLIESFFLVQKQHKDCFALGIIGDMMQRIYLDGKENLEGDIPADWLTPKKKLNHRCPKRIIKLINKIREEGDGQQQEPRSDKIEGTARLFVVQVPCSDKKEIEKQIAIKMGEITKDEKWLGENSEIKTLTLEHHMAAKRMGFDNLFLPLYSTSRLKTGALDGSLTGMRFFTNTILPLYNAWINDDKFEIARIVKEKSPLISKVALIEAKEQSVLIEKANDAVLNLFNLWDNGVPTLLDILRNVADSRLFAIPDTLVPIANRTQEELIIIQETEEEEDEDKDLIIDAWDEALLASFDQIPLYQQYLIDEANFGTHQGVKGREFKRVMVILDDDDARGNWFNFEKLLGVKGHTAADVQNMNEGKETSMDRTLRLLYVTCSRAEESLAIVAYTSNPELFARNIVDMKWFQKEEIEFIN